MIKGFFTALSAVLALVVGLPALAAADPPPEPTITFRGGGWGHGVGMSQFGALGRALDGQTHQEILAFYYDGTTLADASAFGIGGEVVDVHVATTSTVTLTPVGGPLRLHSAAGALFAEVAASVTFTFDGAVWRAVAPHPAPPPENPGATHDYCGEAGCAAGSLSVTTAEGARIVVEGVSEYARGAIELHPAGGASFHVVHGSLTLDEYMYGVAEVPASWPTAALAAQAIAARSYAAAKVALGNEPWDLVSSTSDQVYAGWGQEGACGGWCGAVDLTAGQVLAHGGSIASGFYSSSNGGHTASNTDIWGSVQYPYLLAKPDPFDAVEANPNASWERTLTFSQAEAVVRGMLTGAQNAAMGNLTGLELRNTPPSGHNTFADVAIHHDAADDPIVLTRAGGTLASRVGLLGKRFEIVEFADVPPDAYFAIPVEWMVEHGITTGTGPSTFSPGQPNSRAGLATFLHRFADDPPGTVPTPFLDVPRGAYFERPVGWAADAGVVKGYTPFLFGPAGAVTRADAATMLWRFAGEPDAEGDNPFADVPDDAYFTTAVTWMVEHGITQGTSDTTFSPGDVLTRAHIATFLWRLAGVPDAFTDDAALPSAMRSG